MILLKADVRSKGVVPSLNRHSRQKNTSIATNSRDMGDVQDRCSNYSRETFDKLKTRKTQVIVPDGKCFPNQPPTIQRASPSQNGQPHRPHNPPGSKTYFALILFRSSLGARNGCTWRMSVLSYYKIRRWKKMESFPALSRNKETIFGKVRCTPHNCFFSPCSTEKQR